MTSVDIAQTIPADYEANSEIAHRSSKLLYYIFQMMLSFSQNLAYQYIPLYAKKLGSNEIQMGLLTSVQNVFSTFFSPFFGKSSDKHGRKMFLLLGVFIAIASAISMTFAHNTTQIIVTVGVNAFGLSILVPAWQGALADYTSENTRGGFMGRLMGASYAYVTIALVANAIITPRLPYSELDQYRIIIGLSAAHFIVLIFISWILIDLRNPNGKNNNFHILAPLQDKVYTKFLAVILFWWFWMSLAWSYFPTVMASVINTSVAEVAWIAVAASITQAISSYKMADLIDRIGPAKSIFYGFLTFTIVPINFAFATEWWHLLPAQIIAGVGIGFGFTALQTHILNLAGADRAGNYQGVYNLLWGIVTFVGSFLGGWFLKWLHAYLGTLQLALTYALLIVAFFRFVSNFFMYIFVLKD